MSVCRSTNDHACPLRWGGSLHDDKVIGQFAAWIAEHHDAGDVVRVPAVAEKSDGRVKVLAKVAGVV